MRYKRRCSECQYSFCGSRDAMSDICDSCISDSDTGWYGFSDHSREDEDGHSPHYNSFDDYDDDDDYW